MMTTMAAMIGGVPLALGGGSGSELRQPLGVTIVGGLIVSQCLTLFTTPVVYLFFDGVKSKLMALRRVPAILHHHEAQPEPLRAPHQTPEVAATFSTELT
jgi:hypothetical protein